MNSLHRSLHSSACLVLLFLCAALALGAKGSSASLPAAFGCVPVASSHFAIADLDGDNRPDLATVEMAQVGVSQARYWIGFQMSAGAKQRIGLTGPLGGLEIASRDLNGDNSLDLIVTTTWFKNPVAVLLNDGHGNFTLADAAIVSAAALRPERIWARPNVDTKDAAFAVLARSSSDCALSEGIALCSVQPEISGIATTYHHIFTLAVSVLGRAPPTLVVQV
jgi:hypothetical protein